MSLSGQVTIKAVVSDNQITQVAVKSLRPAMAQKLVQGKPLSDATYTIAQCYVVCKQAQSLAACLALNQTAPDQSQLKRIQLESIDQTLWRWMVDLPKLLQLETQLPEYAKIKQQIYKWLLGSFDSNHPDKDAEPNLDLLQQWFKNLTGVDSNNWQSLTTEQLVDWTTTNSLAAKIIRAADDLIPRADRKTNHQTLCYLSQVEDIDAPDWVKDAIALATHQTDADIEFIQSAHQHWSAPVIQLVSRINQLAEGITAITSDIPMTQYGYQSADNKILSWIMSARGWLLHYITINSDSDEPNQNSVENYQILSPTDSYFSANGIVANYLDQLRLRGSTEAKVAIELCVLAADPCVEYKIEIEHA